MELYVQLYGVVLNLSFIFSFKRTLRSAKCIILVPYPQFIGPWVAQLIEALRCKPEGRGFGSRWCHWNFSLTYSFRSHNGPGVDSGSNRNDNQEYFRRGKGGRCVGPTTLLPSCADCHEIWDPNSPGTHRACPGLCRDCFIFLSAVHTLIIPQTTHTSH